jgi:hypothetical protein
VSPKSSESAELFGSGILIILAVKAAYLILVCSEYCAQAPKGSHETPQDYGRRYPKADGIISVLLFPAL